MTEAINYIPNRVRNAAVGGHVCGSADIIDDDLNKEQSQINSELYNLIVNLPVSDGTDIDAGKAYIDSTDRTVKVKPAT